MKITKKFYLYLRLYLLAMLAVLGFYLAIRCFEKPWISAAALFNIGVVHALSQGETTITIKDSNKEDCAVSVKVTVR